MTQRIAIIGAGYAGLSAGVCLSSQGYKITVFEANSTLGGRARAIHYKGKVLDNGQHLCIGSYTTLLGLISQVGLNINDVFLRLPFKLTLLPHFYFGLANLPTPWNLLFGLGKMQGWTWRERYQLVKIWRKLKHDHYHLLRDRPVTDWLIESGQSDHLIDTFWAPLCLAALNTPINQASAQIFAYVIRDSLGAHNNASNLLFTKVDLSSAFPIAAADFIQRHSGKVITHCRVQSIEPYKNQWKIADAIFDQVIIAVAPQHIVKLKLPAELNKLVAQLAHWQYHAIATVYLQYDTHIRLPHPMQAMINSGGSQWVFDRGQTHTQKGLLAVVISDAPKNISHAVLVEKIQSELFAYFNIRTNPIWYKVIIEKQATFRASVNLSRPQQKTTVNRIWLAGDYTTDYYPATIEGAVRSGQRVAQLIQEYKYGQS